jgi:iron complex outermembrane receptor protein
MTYQEHLRGGAAHPVSRVLCAVLLAALALFGAGQAPAEKPKPSEASDPFLVKTTIVVTATRDEVDIVKSPASTSVITSTDFERRNILLLDQSLSLTEGVNVFRRDSTDGMGGVGMRGFAGRGSAQVRSLVLVDGQPINEGYEGSVNWAIIPVGEVERVEVVRGPFSSLYGGSAMGGVVNVLTRPIDKTTADFSIRYGSLDTLSYQAQVSKRFFDKLGLSLAYSRLQVGGFPSQDILVSGTSATSGTPATGVIPWLTPTGGQTLQVGMRGADWANMHTWRGRAEYSWSAKTALYFQWIHHRNDRGSDGYETYLRNSAGVPVDQGTYLVNGWGLQRITVSPYNYLSGQGGLRTRLYNARLLKSMGASSTLQLSAGLLDTPSDFSVTLANTATQSGGSGTVADRRGRGWYGNALFATRVATRHQVSAGSELRRDSSRSNEWLLPNWTFIDERSRLTAITQGKALTAGFYGQDQITVTDRLNLVIGGRYDFRRTWDGMTDRFTSSTPMTPFSARSKGSMTGKVAAVYQAPRAFTLRASVGTAFRNPSIFELYRASSVLTIQLVPNPDLKPEYLTSWEVGVRKPIGARFSAEGTYYENRVNDLIYRTRDLTADPSGRIRPLTNAGQSRTRGVEAAVQARIFRWLNWRSNYTLQNSVITSNPGLPNTVGKQVPFVPEHMTATTLTAGGLKWTAFVAGRYSGALFATDINNDTTRGVPQAYDPFFLLEGSFGYQLNRHLQLQVNAENLLDRHYFMYKRMPGRTAYASLRFTL